MKCEENKEKILQEEKTSLEGKKQRVQKDLVSVFQVFRFTAIESYFYM